MVERVTTFKKPHVEETVGWSYTHVKEAAGLSHALFIALTHKTCSCSNKTKLK